MQYFITGATGFIGRRLVAKLLERSGSSIEVNGCFLRLALETRNYEHIEEIKKTLSNAGFLLIKS